MILCYTINIMQLSQDFCFSDWKQAIFRFDVHVIFLAKCEILEQIEK